MEARKFTLLYQRIGNVMTSKFSRTSTLLQLPTSNLDFRRKIEHTAPWFHRSLRKHIWLTSKVSTPVHRTHRTGNLEPTQFRLAHVKRYKKEDHQGSNRLQPSPSSGVIGNLSTAWIRRALYFVHLTLQSNQTSTGTDTHLMVVKVIDSLEEFNEIVSHFPTVVGFVSDWLLNEHKRSENPPLSLSNFGQGGAVRARK